MAYEVRNIETNEIGPAHRIGTTEENLPLFAYAEGFEPLFPHESDEDGNWVAISTTKDF